MYSVHVHTQHSTHIIAIKQHMDTKILSQIVSKSIKSATISVLVHKSATKSILVHKIFLI